MSYNTVEQFKLYAAPSGSYNSIPNDVIQVHLDNACAEIDSALRVHHTLPMNTSSYSSELAILYHSERVMTSFELLKWKGFRPNPENTQDIVFINAFEMVTGKDGTLDKLRNGIIKFPQESDATPTVSENRPRVYSNPGRTIKTFDANGNETVIL